MDWFWNCCIPTRKKPINKEEEKEVLERPGVYVRRQIVNNNTNQGCESIATQDDTEILGGDPATTNNKGDKKLDMHAKSGKKQQQRDEKDSKNKDDLDKKEEEKPVENLFTTKISEPPSKNLSIIEKESPEQDNNKGTGDNVITFGNRSNLLETTVDNATLLKNRQDSPLKEENLKESKIIEHRITDSPVKNDSKLVEIKNDEISIEISNRSKLDLDMKEDIAQKVENPEKVEMTIEDKIESKRQERNVTSNQRPQKVQIDNKSQQKVDPKPEVQEKDTKNLNKSKDEKVEEEVVTKPILKNPYQRVEKPPIKPPVQEKADS